jgi:hypothetical protein
VQAYPGKIHICADGWTSPNVIAFIGATAHWVIDGKMASITLDFIKSVFSPIFFCLVFMSDFLKRVTKAHTGEYLGARIAECLREYGIHEKVLDPTICLLGVSHLIYIYRSWDL